MNKTMALIPTTVLLASVTFAGGAAGQPAGALVEKDPAPGQAAREGEEPADQTSTDVAGKPSVLVLNIQPAAGVTEDTTKLLDDLVAVHMDGQKQLEVTAYNDVKQLIELEGEKQAVGCEEAACLADIAGAMGARFVISGRLGKLGSRYLLTFTLFDSEAADNLARVNVNETSLDVVTEKIAPALNEVVAAIPGTEPKTAGDNDAQQESVMAAGASGEEARPADETNSDGALSSPVDDEGGANFLAIGGTAAVGGFGASMMVVGVAYDQLNFWFSDDDIFKGNNQQPDAVDFIGPLVFGVGLVVALASLGFAPFWVSSPEEGPSAEEVQP